MIRLPRLYAVADGAFGDPVRLAAELLDGGATLIQVRDKAASARRLLDEVDEVLSRAPRDAHVIVNDRPDVARLTGAAGSHVGQNDLRPALARIVLSDGQWLGCSTHDLSQAIEADRAPVDYIAVGPIFPTSTKENAAPIVGLDRLREICSIVQKPIVAIGGITIDTVQEVFNCGAASVAVIGDLLKHGSVADRTRAWMRRLES